MASIGNVSVILLYLLYLCHYGQPQVLLHIPERASPFLLVAVLTAGFIILNNNLLRFLKFKQILLMIGVAIWITILFFLSTKSSTVILKTMWIFLIFSIGVVVLMDDLKRFKSLITYLSLVALFFVSCSILRQSKFERNAYTIFSNFLTDPNDYSMYLNMMIPWILLTFDFSDGLWKKVFGVGVLATCFVDLLTFSRGGFLGFIAMAGVLAIYHPKRYQIMGGGIVLALLGAVILSDQWLAIMSTATDSGQSTAQERLTMWAAAWEVFKEHPMGVGPGNAGLFAWVHVPNGVQGYTQGHWYGSALHSLWFTVLSEWGIIGSVLFLSILYLNFRDCRRLIRLPKGSYLQAVGVAGLASMVGFLVSATFLTSCYYPHGAYLTAILCAASRLWAMEVTKSNNLGLDIQFKPHYTT